VWKFDRFGRSAQHLLQALELLRNHGIAFVSTTESVDTGTAMGKMVFTVLAAVAEMERSLTIERIHAGLRNARAKGRKSGVKRQEIDLQAVRDRIGKGESVRQIASVLGISPALLSLRLSGKNRWNKPQQ
jgi:DNA invertase Pin-like site-specific DNA recombinase